MKKKIVIWNLILGNMRVVTLNLHLKKSYLIKLLFPKKMVQDILNV